MKASEVREKLRGNVHPELVRILERIAEDNQTNKLHIRTLAGLIDKLSTLMAVHTTVIDKNQSAIKTLQHGSDEVIKSIDLTDEDK